MTTNENAPGGDRGPESDQEVGLGDRAPEFRLQASNSGEIGLQDYRGQSHVVLFFVREYR
jgi:peroxiredoxin